MIDNYNVEEINKELWDICRDFKLQCNIDYIEYISALLYITYLESSNIHVLEELYIKRKNYYIGEEIDNILEKSIRYKNSNLFYNIRFRDIKTYRSMGEENILTKVIERIYNLIIRIERKYGESQKYISEAYKYVITQDLSTDTINLRGGEIYTPIEIAKIMIDCLQIKNKNAKIMDPYCGSGNLLLSIPNNKGINVYGNEENLKAYNICMTSLLLASIDNRNIKLNKFEKEDNLNIKYDYIISNPPFIERELKRRAIHNQKLINYYGIQELAPGDYSYVLNMFDSLTLEGKMAVILPHGVLFRETEKKVRKYLLQDNYIDAIIGLPENIFFGTKISVIIMILSKNKTQNNIMFIDASQEFTNKRKINILEKKNQDKIIDAYINRIDIPGYSKVATIEEIVKNDYNLNIKKYVKKEIKRQKIKKEEIISNLDILENEKKILEENIRDVLEKLKIKEVLEAYETTVRYSEVDYIRIGKNIRKARREKGYSQPEICKKLQITLDFLYRIEYGKTKITLDKLVEICKVLDVSIEELLGTEEKMKENIFYLKNKGIEYAKGKVTNKGFVILKGSKIKSGIYEGLSKSLINFVQRERNSDSIQNEKFIEDYLCTTPTMAAVLILGRNSNGYTEWKNKEGKTIREVGNWDGGNWDGSLFQ